MINGKENIFYLIEISEILNCQPKWMSSGSFENVTNKFA